VKLSLDKRIVSWALYDWANSAFATTVMAGFFPVFFKQFWSVESSAAQSTFQLGLANSVASLIVVVAAPVLGAIADRGGARKSYLFFFAALGVLTTAALYFVERGAWSVALGLYMCGVLGFMAANVFYDSLLINVAQPKEYDRVSALGFGLGYLGGGLLFAVNVLMTLRPGWFGLDDAGHAVQISFVMVAIWWAVFSLPLLFFVHEPPVHDRAPGLKAVGAGLRQLVGTFRHIRKLKVVGLFLFAYWLYIDGVDTIVRMAVDYGMALGFAPGSLVAALLLTQFVGFPAAIAFGYLGKYFGAKTGIYLGIAVYLGVCIWGYFIEHEWEFYVLAGAIGLVQGGVQSLSRSLYARIIPAGKSAEFFGFYNMLGKFAAVIGPAMMGIVSVLFDSPRLGLLSIIVLFLLGGLLLFFVDEEQGRRMASELDTQGSTPGTSIA